METLKTIKPGTTLIARSIGDYECVFSCKVISRSAKMATVEVNKELKRCKIYAHEGVEFIYAMGMYSMCPVFKAN